MLKAKILLILYTKIIFLVLFISLQAANEENYSLKLIHILFRHGDRTNNEFAVYPNDPYINETYQPYGLAQLTNKGKKTEYLLGQKLRKIYGKFLGNYNRKILEAWSSDTDRTKESLMLVLSGLFPPSPEQIWDENLNWQPIPFNYRLQDEDELFLSYRNCPTFKKSYKEYISSEDNLNKLNKYKDILDYSSKYTGWNVTSFNYLYRLYMDLKIQEEWGLKMPEWTKKIYPYPLNELAAKEYSVFTATTSLKKIGIGYMLKKIVKDTQSKLELQNKNKKKIFLYSGHEINIGMILAALNLTKLNDMPPYGSYIVFEVHKLNKKFAIKILYQNNKAIQPQSLVLPDCEELCDFSKFVSLIQDYIPAKSSCGNNPIIC